MACTIWPTPLVVVGRVMGIIWLGTLLEGAFFMASYEQFVPPQKQKAKPIEG